MGPANTALVFHAGRLLALNEADLPCALRVGADGALCTLGPCDFDGALSASDVPTFTAHPKHCCATGQLHFVSNQVDREPYLSYDALGGRCTRRSQTRSASRSWCTILRSRAATRSSGT
jgi:carotenoid cleavage dioxygenase-like enzyme